MVDELKDGEVWGWAILDKYGFTRSDRPRMQDFFGGAIEVAPTTEEDAKRADLEWPGSAPHRVVTLYTGAHGWKAQHARDSAELRRLCQARDDAVNARQAAQQALQAERERHTAAVNRLQAEIGQLKVHGITAQAQASTPATATLQQRFNDWADGQQIGDASDGCGESPDGRDV